MPNSPESIWKDSRMPPEEDAKPGYIDLSIEQWRELCDLILTCRNFPSRVDAIQVQADKVARLLDFS